MKSLAGILCALVNLVLGLGCLALGLLGLIEGGEMNLPVFPVSGDHAAAGLTVAGGLGVMVSVMALAGSGKRSLPLVLWSAAVAGVLMAATFRSSYKFDGLEGLGLHGCLVAGSLVLLGASWWRFRGSSNGRLGRR